MWQFITARVRSFKYAFQGIADLFRSQPNAWIHVTAVVVVTIAGIAVGLKTWEWAVIVLCFSMVLSAEACNTALEHLTNLVSPAYHPLAGKTKDAAAAAVLILALGSVIIAILIFLPYLDFRH